LGQDVAGQSQPGATVIVANRAAVEFEASAHDAGLTHLAFLAVATCHRSVIF
jgi:hypothetical protein